MGLRGDEALPPISLLLVRAWLQRRRIGLGGSIVVRA